MEQNMANAEKSSDTSMQGAININASAQNASLAIQDMRKVKKKSFENMIHLQNILKEHQKVFQEKKTVKADLEKKNSEIKFCIENITNKRVTVSKQNDKTRQLLEDIANSVSQNNQTLEICVKLKENARQALEKQNSKVGENLKNMNETLKTKENVVKIVEEDFKNQIKSYEDNCKNLEDQIINMTVKLKTSEDEIQSLHKYFNDLNEINKTCLNKIVDAEKETTVLETELQEKQNQENNISKVMKQQHHDFQQLFDEIMKETADISCDMQKDKNEIENLERAIKNEENYCKSLDDEYNTLKNQITTLQKENEQLEEAKNKREVELEDTKKQLNGEIAGKLVEIEKMEYKCLEEQTSLTEAIQAEKLALITQEEITRAIGQYTELTTALESKANMISDDIKVLEEKLTSHSLDKKSQTEELDSWYTKSKKLELESTEKLQRKNLEISTLSEKKELIKNEIQEKTNASLEEINSITSDYDINTAQEIAEFEKQKKQLNEEIECIEKQCQEMLENHMSQDEVLKKLNKECDLLKNKIKIQADFDNVLLSISAMEQTIPKPSTSTTYATSSREYLLPPLPKRQREFDELSGSSAEGQNYYSYEQHSKYKRAIEKRRKQKEQRKLLKLKKFNIEEEANKKLLKKFC